MMWDMLLVTVLLVTVLPSIILLALVSRIWEDNTPRNRTDKADAAPAGAAQPGKIKKVDGREESLA